MGPRRLWNDGADIWSGVLTLYAKTVNTLSLGGDEHRAVDFGSSLRGRHGRQLSIRRTDYITKKILGLYWLPTIDDLQFNIKFNYVNTAVSSGQRDPTKRELLSIVMSVYDPLGFLSHFVKGAKSLMREIWRRKMKWDDSLPKDLSKRWNCWLSGLKDIPF